MFSVKIYILCIALIGANVILADDHESQHEDRRRPFRFPWPTITASWNREEGGDADNATQSQNGDRRRPFLPNFPWWEFNRGEGASGSENGSGSFDRGLISSIPFFVTCNHTTQGGMSCSSCNQVLYCGPNNVGVQRSCGMRYCNEGRCSTTPTEACGPSANSTTA